MKKPIILVLCFTLLLSCFGFCATAVFGTGAEVLAAEVSVVKAGLLGHKLTFSDKDFKSAFCIDDFDKITISSLPASTEGTLLLAGRRVKEGQSIKRKNIAALVFIPASEQVSESSFEFTLDEGGYGAPTKCIMKFVDKVNYAPKFPESSAASLSIVTQSEVSVYGRMSASDPEGDEIEYIIVSYPKNGVLKITDRQEGKYKYTPMASFTGQDKFVYVARDEYGNYSDAVTVSIRTIERMSSQVFRDMTEREEYNAAIAVCAMGIMAGNTVGDDSYFDPDTSVTKAEFVAMAMKAAGIRPDSTLSGSFFDDNDKIPDSLMGYVATAQRAGIIDGSFSKDGLNFEPNRVITRYEAAKIMAAVLGLAEDTEGAEYRDFASAPVWARSSVSAMQTLGIFETSGADTELCGGVTRANAAEYLYRMINAS